jgi:16S rRNA (guanine966-N2)-methyltransferase
VRVIAGTAKGRPLKSVRGQAVRPTADRVRESLFNVLAPRLAGARFLDLFAGSGAVGIEALSRGAAFCLFVDLQAAHLKVAEQNLATTGLAAGAALLRRDALAAVRDLAGRQEPFDLIFVDPPYGEAWVPRALAAITAAGTLAPEGVVICEHHRKDPVPSVTNETPEAGGLTKFRELVFGETVLSFYRRTAAGPDIQGGTAR